MHHYPTTPYTCPKCSRPVPAGRLCWCTFNQPPRPRRPRFYKPRPHYRYRNTP